MYLLLWTKLPWAWEYRCLPLILLPLDMYLEVRSLENKPVLFLNRGYLPIPFNNSCTYFYLTNREGLPFTTSFRAVCRLSLQAFWQKWNVASLGCCLHFSDDWWLWTLFHFPLVLCLLLKMFTLILSIFTLDCLLSYWFESHTFLLLTLYQTHYSEVLSLNM